MISRRQALLSAIAGALPCFAKKERFKRVFRATEGKGWFEIAWEDMRVGDSIIAVEMADPEESCPLAVWLWKISEIVSPTEIAVSEMTYLIPPT